MDTFNEESVGAGAGFAALAIGVAAALVPVRTELGGANVALLLVMIVVAAATVGGRVAGVVTGLSAAVAFNFFHTKPYLTVRVDAFKDIVTIGLIVIIGFAVGELGVARSRQSAFRRAHLQAVHSLEEVGALVSSGTSVEQVWPVVREALTKVLRLRGVRFESEESDPLPMVERDGQVDVADKRFTGQGFALPAQGAALSVDADGRHLGRLVLLPDPRVGVTREQRRAAVALADQLAIALRTAPSIHSLS